MYIFTKGVQILPPCAVSAKLKVHFCRDVTDSESDGIQHFSEIRNLAYT